ncbi:metallophosphoesterase [Phytohabitans aurantiacus]|uniref:Membrane protein n=1 Tax=Phytohabitans aurantiacus TaxID=3016789 RepID=A0ABQ5QLI2_9ACTN|nr:metallophosphoesterase [Phytohabitans aurantiacus]GLH95184.1 membrane protein [Phytohabitans aurantiacus]
MIVGFLVFAVVVLGLIHLYLWKRLVRDTTRPGPWRRAGGIAAIVLPVLVAATLVGTRVGVWWLAWPGYLWLALMFYLLVTLVLLEIPMLAAKIWLRVRRRRAAAAPAPERVEVGAAVGGPPAEPPASETPAPAPEDHDNSRRLLLARGAAIFAGLTAASVTGYGVRSALGPPQIDRVRVPLAKLPRSMDGTRIALVSDIHLGPLRGLSHTQRIVSMINDMDADVVAVVGDLVDGTVEELGAAAAPLRDLRSRRGSFFVTGNHEYFSGYEPWLDELTALGVRPLRNERLEIDGLDLAGVNDVTGEDFDDGPDFAKTFGGRDSSRPVVLLAHQPVQVHEAAKHGVDLQLSGHTHGGQMVPFHLLVALEQPVVNGLATIDGTQVYVTNGAGFWGPPVRVGAPPQVTLVELTAVG